MSPPGRPNRNNPRTRPGDGQNKWTHDQRLTLHLLHARFAFTLSQRANVFNAIFAKQLRRCGVAGGLSKTGLSAQYAERLKTSVAARTTWEKICKEVLTEAEKGKRELIVEQIERVARGLGIVVRRCPDGRSAAPRQSGREARSALSTPVQNDLDDLHLEDSEDETMLTPTPTPGRPKRTSSQYSKWTFNSSPAMPTEKDMDSDSDFLPEPSPDLDRFSRSSPRVVVPMTPKCRGRPRKEEAKATSLSTPKKSPPRKTPTSVVRRKEIATMEYARPNGNIMLTPEEFEATKAPLVAPSADEVHPPLAGLLFRYIVTPT